MGGMLRRWLEEHGYTIYDVWMVIGAIFAVLTVVYYLGKITDTRGGHYIGDTEDMLRGGCLLVVLGGVGLVFVAAVVWAWRYLFG